LLKKKVLALQLVAYALLTANLVKVASLDLHLLLSGDIQHVAAQNDVEEVEVLGRDGSIIVDKHRLKTVVQPYEFYLKLPAKVKMQNAIDAVSDWLSPVRYCELEKSWDKDYIYLALAHNQESAHYLTETV